MELHASRNTTELPTHRWPNCHTHRTNCPSPSPPLLDPNQNRLHTTHSLLHLLLGFCSLTTGSCNTLSCPCLLPPLTKGNALNKECGHPVTTVPHFPIWGLPWTMSLLALSETTFDGFWKTPLNRPSTTPLPDFLRGPHRCWAKQIPYTSLSTLSKRMSANQTDLSATAVDA